MSADAGQHGAGCGRRFAHLTNQLDYEEHGTKE